MKRLVIILTMLSASTLCADVIRMEEAKFAALKIAIPNAKVNLPNALSMQLANDLIATVREDLRWSGVFEVLDPKSYVADLSKEGLSKNSIRILDWTQIGAEALVKTELTLTGQDISAEIAIHPLAGLKRSFQKTFTANTKQSKRLAHSISDEVLMFFTGEPGIFNSQIAVAKDAPGGKRIAVLDIDGGNERILTSKKGIHILPTLVPEGDAVLYTAYSNNNANLMQINIDGTGIKTLSSKSDLNTGAQVSPDRKHIAFTGNKSGDSEIYLADRFGGNQKKITDSLGINMSPSFSPDGSKIAFVSSMSGNPQIYLMGSDGSNPKRLTFQGKYNQTPRFSPKGDYIAFTGRDERNKFDIFLYAIATGAISRVTQDQGNNEDPWFSPNGRLLIFTSTRDGKRELFISTLDGNLQKRVTFGGGYWTPSWGPSK